jgi:hypothetical protein
MHTTIEIILNYYDTAYANSMVSKKDRILQEVHWDGTTMNDFADYLLEQTRQKVNLK